MSISYKEKLELDFTGQLKFQIDINSVFRVNNYDLNIYMNYAEKHRPKMTAYDLELPPLTFESGWFHFNFSKKDYEMRAYQILIEFLKSLNKEINRYLNL